MYNLNGFLSRSFSGFTPTVIVKFLNCHLKQNSVTEWKTRCNCCVLHSCAPGWVSTNPKWLFNCSFLAEEMLTFFYFSENSVTSSSSSHCAATDSWSTLCPLWNYCWSCRGRCSCTRYWPVPLMITGEVLHVQPQYSYVLSKYTLFEDQTYWTGWKRYFKRLQGFFFVWHCHGLKICVSITFSRRI